MQIFFRWIDFRFKLGSKDQFYDRFSDRAAEKLKAGNLAIFGTKIRSRKSLEAGNRS